MRFFCEYMQIILSNQTPLTGALNDPLLPFPLLPFPLPPFPFIVLLPVPFRLLFFFILIRILIPIPLLGLFTLPIPVGLPLPVSQGKIVFFFFIFIIEPIWLSLVLGFMEYTILFLVFVFFFIIMPSFLVSWCLRRRCRIPCKPLPLPIVFLWRLYFFIILMLRLPL